MPDEPLPNPPAPDVHGGALTTDATPPIPPEDQAEPAPVHMPEQPPYDLVPEGDTLGVKHIREALADLEWPLTKAALLERAGAWRIPVTGAHFHPLEQWLVGVPEGKYRTVDDLVDAVRRAERRR